MSVNVNSITDSYNAWYDYKYKGNTRNISSSEFASIEHRWSNNLTYWKQMAESDKTEYEISDNDFNLSVNDGKNSAKQQTGYNGKTGGMWLNSGSTAVLGTATALSYATKGGRKVAQNVGAKVTGTSAKNAIKTTNGKTTTPKNNKLGARATVVLAAVVAAKYWVTKPNKEQHEAAKELKDELLPEADGKMEDARNMIDDAAAETQDLTEQAEEANEETNDEIEDEKTQFDAFRKSLEALIEKLQSGQPLTDSEKELVSVITPILEDMGGTIEDLADENSKFVNDLYDEIDANFSYFEDASDLIGEAKGVTEYAAGFDEQSKWSCFVEGAGQTLNGIGAGLAAAKLAVGGPWNWAFSAIGIAAAASSGMAAWQQKDWAGHISEEINVRKESETMNDEVLDFHTESLDEYNDNTDLVKNLNMYIPEDLEVPETGDIFAQNGNSTGVNGVSTSPSNNNDGEDKKDKKDDTGIL